MPQHLSIVADPAGLPCAEVPFNCMWQLVEYLSFQRVAVTYQYEPTHFIVTFPRQTVESAQQILDRWAENYAESYQMA